MKSKIVVEEAKEIQVHGTRKPKTQSSRRKEKFAHGGAVGVG